MKRQRQHVMLELGKALKKGSAVLAPGESVIVKPLSPITLSNQGGTIALYDEKNRQIDRVKYSKEDAKKQGKPIILFEYQPD